MKTMTYACELYEKSTVDRLVCCLVGLLHATAECGNASVHDIPIV
jgi:hypothetical protein